MRVRQGCLVAAALAAAACGSAPEVDRLFLAARVHGGNGPDAVAVAVRAGRIVAVADAVGARRLARAAREVVDLGPAQIYPGFTEGHGHLLGYGAALEQVDLTGTSSFEDVVERVRRAAQHVPPGEWVLGRGWDQNRWADRAFPHHQPLSAAVPHHPVLLRRVDGHAAVANAAALKAARITAATPDPPGGLIVRDAGGEPTGVLVDNACDLVAAAAPPPSVEVLTRRALRAAEALARLGFTEIHDAGATRDGLAVLRRLQAEGRLPVRVYAMVEGSDEEAVQAEFAGGPSVTPDGMLAVRAVKLYADGALGSRGALLAEPYSDAPTVRGLEVMDEAQLAGLIRRAGAAGFQVCTHAIGDAAVTRVLDLYERELGPLAKGLRPRIEHAQIVRPQDVGRFAGIGVIAAVQPTHCTSDMPWAGQRLGPERIRWAYRWRSLLDAGAHLCLGSDVPVEDPDPRLGIWAAVTRRTLAGTPMEGWNVAEALTAEEAVAGYTTWAAYAAFEEDWRGAIRPGFAADFTVVDRDLTAEAGMDVTQVRILRTVVGGRDVVVARGVE